MPDLDPRLQAILANPVGFADAVNRWHSHREFGGVAIPPLLERLQDDLAERITRLATNPTRLGSDVGLVVVADEPVRIRHNDSPAMGGAREIDFRLPGKSVAAFPVIRIFLHERHLPQGIVHVTWDATPLVIRLGSYAKARDLLLDRHALDPLQRRDAPAWATRIRGRTEEAFLGAWVEEGVPVSIGSLADDVAARRDDAIAGLIPVLRSAVEACQRLGGGA